MPRPKTLNMTTDDLRKMMFEEIQALRSGKGDHKRARTMTSLVGQIVSTAKLDMEYAAFMGGNQDIPKEIAPLKLT